VLLAVGLWCVLLGATYGGAGRLLIIFPCAARMGSLYCFAYFALGKQQAFY
jgi:hypothetical protein